jgi:hypothetical protein
MAKPCDMKVLEVKTARFAVVVEKCGTPEGLQSLAKAGRRPQVSVADQEPQSDDDSGDGCRDRVWSGGLLRAPRCALSRVSEIGEALRGPPIVGINWELVTS